jgi:hypothetical protein
MNRYAARLRRCACLPVLLLATWGSSLAAVPAEPGRLFYTPYQRAQLEAARARNVTQARPAGPAFGPPPVRFDGMVIRSDGTGTRWVNGQPQAGASGVPGLKPGQIRADGRVYEPYQVLRPSPDPAIAKDPTP